MHIDQAGNARQRTQIDDFRAGRNRARAGADTRYAVASYDDDGVGERVTHAVDETREPDSRRLRRGGGSRKAEDEKRATEDLE